MSSSFDKAANQLAALPDRTDYEVGYKKPPVHSRFQKGQSGNPSGRPKGAKNKLPGMNEERLKEIILEEAYRAVPVQDQGKTLSIPLAQAVVRSLAVNAAKGNTRAQKLFTEMLAGTEEGRRKQYDALMETAINYKVEWERELERCNRLGISKPEPIPHPDHVVIDFHEGTVHFDGPMTKEEKAELDMWAERLSDFEEELAYLENELEQASSKREGKQIGEEIEKTEKVISIIKRILPYVHVEGG